MGKGRYIACPRCGAEVRIPLYWALGIEGIFRCRECKLRFKTGYKMGAVLFALALTLAVATAQLLVFLLSIYSMAFFVLAIVPLWLLYGFIFRKSYLMGRMKRYARKHPITEQEARPEEGSPGKLPRDTSFDPEPESDGEAPAEEPYETQYRVRGRDYRF